MKLLESEGELTVDELAESLGRHTSTIKQSIAEGRKRNPDALHIARWDRHLLTGGRPSAVWAIGKGADKAPPKSLSRPEIARRCYRNHKAVVLTKQRARRVKNSADNSGKSYQVVAQWFDILKV